MNSDVAAAVVDETVLDDRLVAWIERRPGHDFVSGGNHIRKGEAKVPDVRDIGRSGAGGE